MNVLDFAQHMEQSSQQFYRRMSSRNEHPGVRKIFTMLAEDEERLLQRLREEKAEFRRCDSAQLNDSESTFERLLRENEQHPVETDIEAYNLILTLEQGLVDEYEKALSRETRPEVRQLLQRIVGEERRQLESIEQVHDFANAPKEFLEWGEFINLAEFHSFGRDVGM